jgi:hypothetical protein
MWSLNSFSQIDTTSTTLPNKLLREVAKDLIRYDGCREELDLTYQKLEKIAEREQQKDFVIDVLTQKDGNNQFIINQLELQSYQYEKLTDDLTKELKQQKVKSVLWKIGTAIGVITTSYLIVK